MLRSGLITIPRSYIYSHLRCVNSESVVAERSLWIYLQQQRFFNTTQSVQQSNDKITQKDNGDDKKKITYSKRRFVNLEGAENRPYRHLYTLPSDVYGTSKRVTELLEKEGMDQAIEFVTHLPLDLQSTVIWNQLIGFSARFGKANFAESLFFEMRRRGFKPSEVTFAELIKSFIKNSSPTRVKRAEGWIGKMKEQHNISPTVVHYNILLKVYAQANSYNQVVAKVRQMMRPDGLLPFPDNITLSLALQSCPLVFNQPNKEIKRIWDHIVWRLEQQNVPFLAPGQEKRLEETKSETSLEKKVRLLLTKDVRFRNDLVTGNPDQSDGLQQVHEECPPLQVDDTLVATLLKSLGRTNLASSSADESHFALVMDIMDRLYGLRPETPLSITDGKPSEENEQQSFGLVPGVSVLDVIVRYCGSMKQFELGEAYFDLAIQRFPQLEPDQQAYDALTWMQTHTRRRKHKKA